MRRVLITGMSGTGKSSVIEAIARAGYKAIDTGWNPEWETPPPPGDPDADGPGWIWREDRISELLSTEGAEVLFLSACVPNQSRFYARFDHVVLLSVSPEVTAQRLSSRSNNPYGKSAGELGEVLRFKSTLEPRLRSSATEEIDTDRPLGEVVARIVEIAGREPSASSL